MPRGCCAFTVKVRPSYFLSPCVFTKRLHTAAHPWPELSGGREENKTKLRRSGGRLTGSEELFPSDRGVKSRRAAAAPGPERPPERDFFNTSFDFSVGKLTKLKPWRTSSVNLRPTPRCRRRRLRGTMLVKEYRICMPLTVEEDASSSCPDLWHIGFFAPAVIDDTVFPKGCYIFGFSSNARACGSPRKAGNRGLSAMRDEQAARSQRVMSSRCTAALVFSAWLKGTSTTAPAPQRQLLTALVTFTRELKPSSFSSESEKGLDYDRFGHEVTVAKGSVTYMNAGGKVIQRERVLLHKRKPDPAAQGLNGWNLAPSPALFSITDAVTHCHGVLMRRAQLLPLGCCVPSHHSADTLVFLSDIASMAVQLARRDNRPSHLTPSLGPAPSRICAARGLGCYIECPGLKRCNIVGASVLDAHALVLHYRIGQLYMISKHSHEQSERGEGVEVVQNEPYQDPEHGSGQFTEKRIYLNNKLPSWARAVVPKIFYLTEKAWNYYPYTITGKPL
ncbi:Cytoplasmic phosphatidylinositol transfer protein 1 [Takifugu flavidus]|uniref:Cytoplasmic phosphatidylinositol transfer protein 1 n=1 Tax=Takifugu flavidus TaxID=433684 RepID=A0A5C6NSX2_9TELE|nr:Cytoplasmic phosphatidylinositol transfer protein 1 [Takifugu flavidus]